MFNPINSITSIQVLSKTVIKTEDLSKKVSLNDIMKTVHIFKNFIKDFKKSFWNRNNSNK